MKVLYQNSGLPHESFGRGIQGGYVRSKVQQESKVNSSSTADTNGLLDHRPPTPPCGTRPGLARAKSDVGPRRAEQEKYDEDASKENAKDEWKIRHGWEAQLTSEDILNQLNNMFRMHFADKVHETGGNPKDTSENYPLHEWRMKDRLKTVSAVLALCLNIGVDPPDVIKTNPCARLECWIDPANPNGAPGHTPLNQIGKALQTQYEQLSMRTRYKLCLDPTVDETKKYCTTARRNAKDERILFHYNGHGVPKPTTSGEIWVFNRNYTQYIPISLYDLQHWLAAPSLFVWDCASAGLIIQNFNRFVEKHEGENAEIRAKDPTAQLFTYSDCMHVAACAKDEVLPTNPSLPADLFTSCLTTPIEMAVRFFILQNPLPSKITLNDAANIPGRVSERRTPIGELNWIFTAITDTIAWNCLSKPLFKKLFRQDLMVAALFRNFLLAQRVMRVYHAQPQCYPEIPQTYNHPLWDSWDLSVEMILAQLPDLLAAERREKHYEYQHSQFFAEQLTAFEVYLGQGAVEQKVPEQLPIVLQVLLSQVHRLRALILLSKFLDLGPWAVNLALNIGIFPYVQKLLQSQAIELKPVMVFIWARILAVDQSCQADLLKDNGYQYFISILSPNSGIPIGNASEHRAMCAFIIAIFCKDFHQGQVVSLSPDLMESCLGHLDDDHNPLLRQWSCLCISMLWVDHPEAKWAGIRFSAHQRLCELVVDPVPEVRAAMLHALTTFLGIPDLTDQVAHIEASIAANLVVMTNDGNILIRKELLVFYARFVMRYEKKFVVAAYEQILEEKDKLLPATKEDLEKAFNTLNLDKMSNGINGMNSKDGKSKAAPNGVSFNTIFSTIWKQILIMSVDPYPEVARNAVTIVDYVFKALLSSPLNRFAEPALEAIIMSSNRRNSSRGSTHHFPHNSSNHESYMSRPSTPTKQDGFLPSGVIKRTASVAASLKSLAFGSQSTTSSPSNSLKRQTTSKGSLSQRQTGPRANIPPEWSRPPDDRDYSTLTSYQPARVPQPKGFEEVTQNELSMPLQSRFFDWAVEYFREPQMKPSEADEPGSTDYNEKLWRRNRNDRIISSTQPQKSLAGTSQWNRPSGMFNNVSQPVKIVFHQFENHLIATDDRDTVSVWDWKRQYRMNRFSNGNPSGSKITEARLINEDDRALLMTGSSDGVIKVFKNYAVGKRVELVSAFRALTDLVPSNKNAGLVFEWQQGRGSILVAGDVRVIRVWNAALEICTSDIPARSGSCVTSLTSEQVEGQIFVAGFGDGAVRIYDQRLKASMAMVKVWKEHRQWITNVHLQRGGQRELISGCRSGEVKLWDIRMDKSVHTINATANLHGRDTKVLNYGSGSKDTLRTLSVHEHAPVFATGSERHSVNVYNTSGEFLSSCEPISSFLHQSRVSPISATTFHPHRMMLACSSVNDPHINIFSVRSSSSAAPGSGVSGNMNNGFSGNGDDFPKASFVETALLK